MSDSMTFSNREQKVVNLPSFKRGCHVVTSKVMEQLPEICEFEVGMANFFSEWSRLS
jgi:hypothetical protein